MSGGLSRREFARQDGCSESLVRQGLVKGWLVAFEDGTIDASLVGSPWRASARHAQSGEGFAGNLVSFAEAQRRKENYLAKLRELEYLVKSGQLGLLSEIEKGEYEFSRLFRDSLTNWTAQESPLMAAELGIEQVKLAVVLEKYVRKYLSDLSDRLRKAG